MSKSGKPQAKQRKPDFLWLLALVLGITIPFAAAVYGAMTKQGML